MNMRKAIIAMCMMTVVVMLSSATGRSETPSPETAAGARYTITIHAGDFFDPPHEERYFAKMVESMFNVDIKTVVLRDERLQLALNTGDVPDIMGLWKHDAVEYRDLFVDIDQYMSRLPNVLGLVGDYPNQEHMAQDGDGRFVFVPSVVTNNLPMLAWMTNKTLLDELGLDVPDTMDEFYEAMVAFKEYNPSAYPISGMSFFGSILTFDNLVTAFLNETDYVVADDRFVYKWLKPEALEFLRFARRMHDEGLLHPEYLTETGMPADFLTRDRLFYSFWAQTSWGPGGNMDDPSFSDQIVGMLPPRTPWGTRSGNAIPSNIVGNGTVLNANLKDVPGKLDRVLEMIDWMYSEEGVVANQWGVEGLTFEVRADGTRIFTDQHKAYLASPDDAAYNPAYYDTQGFMSPVMDNWLANVTPEWVDFFAQYESVPDAEFIRGFNTPPTPMNDDEQRDVNELTLAANDYVMPMVHRIITGREPLSAWASTVRELERMGAGRIGEIKTGAYRRWEANQ